MLKHLRISVIFLAVFAFLAACAPSAQEAEQAEHALERFFVALVRGYYPEAVDLYGGSYETLIHYSPDIDPEDHESLWEYGCKTSGIQCMPVRVVDMEKKPFSREYIFTVEFHSPEEGMVMRYGGTSGSFAENRFEYHVIRGSDGKYRVMDMPVYAP
jgi:hypothetical protein